MSAVRGFVSRHRVAVGGSLALAIALVVFVLVWFQPQKLFLNKTVDEGIPAGTATAPGEATVDQTPAEAEADLMTLAVGSFRSLEHQTTGRALILELPDGRRFLRFEDLDTSNGPALRVYLSEVPAGTDLHAYGERFVDLGGLKGNLGNQNYPIPAEVDLAKYRSAVIWCARFSVGFGVAPLEPPSGTSG